MTTRNDQAGFLHWTPEQSALGYAGKYDAHDQERIAEELADMGRDPKLALWPLLRQIQWDLL